MYQLLLTLCLLIASHISISQLRYSAANAHSHNDYLQPRPFWLAFEQRCGSVEVDIFLQGDRLMVAHDSTEIHPDRTLESLYLNPIAGRCRRRTADCRGLQLLIDLKTAAVPTLSKLVEQLSRYPDVFGTNGVVQVVVSGNMPPADSLVYYPDWLRFDGRFHLAYSDVSLEKVAMFSASFGAFSEWKGEGPLPVCDLEKMKVYIATAHARNKKVRFWGVPDVPEAWALLMRLGADWIGTDQPKSLVRFLRKSKNEAGKKS